MPLLEAIFSDAIPAITECGLTGAGLRGIFSSIGGFVLLGIVGLVEGGGRWGILGVVATSGDEVSEKRDISRVSLCEYEHEQKV